MSRKEETLVMRDQTLLSLAWIVLRLALRGYRLVPGYCTVTRNGQFGPGSYEIDIVAEPKGRNAL